MSKLATMVGLIIDSEKKQPSDHHRHQKRSQTPEKLRPPPGSRDYSSLSRSRSVTVGSASTHPISKSKETKLVVHSLQRRNPQPEAAGVLRRNKTVRSKGKKSSKRSIISFVFAGHRRRRSSSLSSISTLSSSSSASTRLGILMRKHDSNSNCKDDEIGGKYSSLSLSSSLASSTSSIGGRKGGKKKRQSSRGKAVNSANCGCRILSRGNSLRINGSAERIKGEERFELCKLKLLMGGKCRPLNSSGKLRYDEDGVLVPDPLSP